MKKALSIFLITCMFLLYIPVKVFANFSLTYYEPFKIGLESMASNQILVTLNGDYKVNEILMPSGTKLTLLLSNDLILLNENLYQIVKITPINNNTTVTLTITIQTESESKTISRKYLGSLDFVVKNNLILPINTLDIEDYLKGVVPYEMSDSFPLEALKAQAVAARCYALSNKGKHKQQGYDLCDTIHCQVYGGYDENKKNSIRAVEETKGIILTYNGKIISAYFSASNGGFTEASKNIWSADLPYLKVKKDDFDDYKWPENPVKLTSQDIDKRLKQNKILSDNEKFLRIDLNSIQKNESNKISKLNIVYLNSNGIESTKTLIKEQPRTAFSLRSTMYDITYDVLRDEYTFIGQGYGHGVGLSQIGAKNRAYKGQKFNQILLFYYDGVKIESLTSKLNSVNINKDKILIGEELTVNPSVNSENINEILFGYEILKNGQVIEPLRYSNNATFKYLLNSPGEYILKTYIKNIYSTKEFDDCKEIKFTVFSPAKITNIIFDKNAIYQNKPVSITIATSGGSGELQYKIDILKNNVLVYSQDFTINKTFIFTPKDIGEYTVKTTIKDNNAPYESNFETKFNVISNVATTRGYTNLQSLNINRVLKKGMKGQDVKNLQNILVRLGYLKSNSVTGYFGPQTEAAVKSFQKAKGLKPDGIVGKDTLLKLIG